MGLLVAGVVSPNLVWCHESDGRVSVEYDGGCSLLPVSQPTSDAMSLGIRSSDSCDSCVDVPIFIVGPNSKASQNEKPPSLPGATVALIESAPSQTPNLQPLISLSLDTYQINLTLSSVRSTILVI